MKVRSITYRYEVCIWNNNKEETLFDRMPKNIKYNLKEIFKIPIVLIIKLVEYLDSKCTHAYQKEHLLHKLDKLS